MKVSKSLTLAVSRPNENTSEKTALTEHTTQDKNISLDQESPQDQKSTYPTGRTDQSIEKLKQGYTRIPNSILMDIISGDLSKAEIKILLLIGRMTISFNDRKTVSLSKASIERFTRMQGKNILQAIHSLEAKGIILKIPGDQYTANQLGLVFEKDLFNGDHSETKKESKSESPKQDQMISEGKNQSQDQKSTYSVDQKGTHSADQKSTHFKQYSSNENRNNTHSPTQSVSKKLNHEFIQTYFNTLKPERKRDNEWKNFLSLRKDFPEEQIARSLEFLLKRGIPKTGEPCHSPMSFLGIAMQDVQSELNKTSEQDSKRAAQEAQKQTAQQQQIEQGEREHQQFEMKKSAFEKAFPTADTQQAYLARFAKRYPFLSLNGPAIKNMAITAWASEAQTITQ